VPPKPSGPWPAAPRLPAQLDAGGPLEDGGAWAGADAGAQQSFDGGVRDFDITASRLRAVRLTGAVLEGGRWADVVVEDCELSGMTLEGTTWARVAFRGCRMSGMVAIGVKAVDVMFTDCRIDAANFRGSAFERCAFDGCDLARADFYGARLAPGAMRRCSLVEADFSKAQCEGLDLRGSDLSGVIGAASLRGCTITPEQMVPLGLALVASLGVRVEDTIDDPVSRRSPS